MRDWLAGQRTYCRCINPYQGLAHPKLVRGVAPCVTSFSGTSPLRTSRPCQSVQLRLQQGSWLSGGNVTLDAQGNANAIFIFQIGSTLTTITSTPVVLVGAVHARTSFGCTKPVDLIVDLPADENSKAVHEYLRQAHHESSGPATPMSC